jgi:hypothetical protein
MFESGSEQLRTRKSRQRSNGWQQGRASHKLMLPRRGPLRLLTATGLERQQEKRSIEESNDATQVERNVRARRPIPVINVRKKRLSCEREETLDDVLARREVWKKVRADKAAADTTVLPLQGDEHVQAHAQGVDLGEIDDGDLEKYWQAAGAAAIRGLLGLHTQDGQIQSNPANYLVMTESTVASRTASANHLIGTRSMTGTHGLGNAQKNITTENCPEGTVSIGV